jgi:transcriptional regulator with XRE-family HTH domain
MQLHIGIPKGICRSGLRQSCIVQRTSAFDAPGGVVPERGHSRVVGAFERRSPTVHRRRLGSDLRHLREGAGLTIESVAVALECSDSKISRIETGQVSPSPRDIRDMLELYGVSRDRIESLVAVAREARQKAWWQEYRDDPAVPLAGLEAAASSIDTYEALLVPGLLQTREYARAVVRSILPDMTPDEIERTVEFRMRRQAVLMRKNPPTLHAILDEAAVRRPVGGAATMRKQVLHLIDIGSRPNVTLQMLPFAAGEHAGMNGQLTCFAFEDSAIPDVVYVEAALSNNYVERPEEVAQYRRILDSLGDLALKPVDSAEFLNAIAKESF